MVVTPKASTSLFWLSQVQLCGPRPLVETVGALLQSIDARAALASWRLARLAPDECHHRYYHRYFERARLPYQPPQVRGKSRNKKKKKKRYKPV